MIKLITFLSFIFLAQVSLSQTECDLFFEDFESYSTDSGLIEQRPDEWLFFRANVPDGEIIGLNDNALNITSPLRQGDTSLSPLFIHKLNIENTGRISYKSYLYQECGIIAWYFLGHFKDSIDNSIFLEIEEDLFYKNIWKINGQTFD